MAISSTGCAESIETGDSHGPNGPRNDTVFGSRVWLIWCGGKFVSLRIQKKLKILGADKPYKMCYTKVNYLYMMIKEVFPLKYWRGYIVAGILAAITIVVMQLGQRLSTLVDMVYPYVARTAQNMLATWSGGVDFLLWQLIAVFLLVLLLATVVLMLILKWNPVQWFGWVLTACVSLYLCHTLVYGLNYYAGSIATDIRMEVTGYTVTELTEAAEYYRDMANELAPQVKRDSDGNVQFAEFDVLANQAGNGFQHLTYDYSYPIFAGITLPVKELGWADMYTSMGITGMHMGLTGESAVNPQIPDVSLPFTMCHEMSHRMCIATEGDANFAAFLACQANDSVEFQYSAYFMAYRYCYSALNNDGSAEASAAAARVEAGVSDLLAKDLEYYNDFFNSHRSNAATGVANVANDAYLKTSGDEAGVKSYGQVADLLVSWHIQEIVLPSITEEEKPFDPYDESQVDLEGLVPEETVPNE